MVTDITCSMLESPSTYDYNEINTGVYKSTRLEPTIKHLMKETRLFCRAARNLVSMGHNIRAKRYIMKYSTLKEMRGCLINNTIIKRLREEIVERILSHTNINPSCVPSDVINFFNAE